MSSIFNPAGAGVRPRFLRVVFLVFIFLQPIVPLLFAGGLSSGQPQTGQDLWYVIKIGGNTVGYSHESLRILPARTPEGQGSTLQTASEMRLALNRLGVKVELAFVSTTEESAEGRLQAIHSEITASNQKTTAEVFINPGIIEIQSEAGGKKYARTLNYAGDLYGPEGIRRLSVLGLKNPGDEVAVQTFIPEASLVSQLSRTLISEETLSVEDENFPTLKVEETFSGIAVKRTVWLDRLGNVVKQEEPGPFGITEALRSDEAAALAAAAGGELPEEIYKSSIVRTNIRLPRAKSIDRMRLRLSHKNPSLGWPDMNGPNQKVLEKTEKTLDLEIQRPRLAKGMTFPAVMTEENRIYLRPNVYIQSDDPGIESLAKRLVAGHKDILSAALILERWVAENMKFDLGIAFAPATEIFQDRRGTCVGYATLLAALSRAAGIPSRLVMGYVYALGMFGGHAWTEIRAGERWIPLDAAIVNEGVADATRFYCAASSLADGWGELALGPAQQVFGQVGIEILEYETAGTTYVVPNGAKSFDIKGNVYDNPWVGMKFEKPADFQFTGLDAVWPDPTVIRLEGPAGAKATLEQKAIDPWEDAGQRMWEMLDKLVPDGRRKKARAQRREIFYLDSRRGLKSAAAIGRGLEVFVWTIEAKDAPKIARQIASNFKLKQY